MWSAIGKEFTLATNQVDFAIPERFGLKYIDESGSEKIPICIHRAPLSTHERMIGFLIEHFAGDFPIWLAPVQAVIIPISEKYMDYAKHVKDIFMKKDIRIKLDTRDEKVGAKIRDAELQKIPIMLIVGEKEKAAGNVSVRRRLEGDLGMINLDTLIKDIHLEIQTRARRKPDQQK